MIYEQTENIDLSGNSQTNIAEVNDLSNGRLASWLAKSIDEFR